MKAQNTIRLRSSCVWSIKSWLAVAIGAAGLALSAVNTHAQWFPDRSPIYVSPRQVKPAPKPAEASSAAQPTLVEPSPAVVVAPDDPALLTQRIRRNEVSFSTDFMLGQGEVTVPIGYSVQKSLGGAAGQAVPVEGQLVDRDSEYFGGTLSYSYNEEWHLDLSYSQGESSGNVSFNAFKTSDFKTDFTIDDQWYQAYVRYAFEPLAKLPIYIYLRGGVTYVTADLEMKSIGKGVNRYRQDTSTDDILGNLGFGVRYIPYRKGAVNIGLNVEGEGFFGFRTQEARETLGASEDLTPAKATIDNDLYGGIGRMTARFEYAFGRAREFKAFAEAGVQGRFTMVEYPDADTEGELLWGPYAKLGLRFRF